MPLSYRDILDQYDAQQEAGATTETLPQWSSRMNTLTGTDLYSAGYHDNWVKRASVGIDRLLEKTGAPEVGAEVGRAVGGLVGQPEVGEETGRGLPRMLVNLAPMAIPGAGIPATAARVGLTAALSGAETYTATDSPLAGVISGATFAAMPNVAQAAEEAVVKRLVARGAAPITQKIGGVIAGQAGALGTMTAGQVGTQLATGQEVTNPLSPEGATALAISQLPFAAIHLGSRALGLGKPVPDIQKMLELTKSKTELATASKEREQKTPIEQTDEVKQPLELDPIIAEQTAAILSRVRGEQLDIKNNPNLTNEDKVREINAKLDEEARVRRIHEPPADGVFGNTILPESPREAVLGRQIKINKDGTWRAVLVADDPSNPENLRGKIVGYSIGKEPPPEVDPSGMTRFHVSEPQWRSFVKTQEEWGRKYVPRQEAPQAPTEQLLSEFPTQPELTPQALSEHLNELRNIEAETSQAQTPAELQQAVVKLHGVQGETDTSLTNDTSLNVAQERALNASVKPVDAAKAAVATEIKKTQKKIQSELPSPEEYGKIAEQLGAGGFTIIDSSHVSHGDSTDIAEQPGVEIVNEAAHNAIRNPAVRAAFEGWSEKGEYNFGKDVGDFNDLVDKFGGLNNVKANLKAAAEYLGVGRGFGSRDPADVAEYLERPHVQEMFRSLDENLTRQQLANRALVPPSILNVIGRKGTLLKNEDVNKTVESFVKGQDVVDAFGGSGQLAQFAKGAGARTVGLNILEPRMRAVFQEIKTNPEDFAQRVASAVAPIKSSREISVPTLEDGSPLKPYLDKLAETDPNVALFIQQNLNAKGREVVGGAFSPTKVLSSVGLKALPDRIREFSKSIDTVTGEDGWQVVANAKQGDRVLVDPPYVGTTRGTYTETEPVSVQQQLSNYEQFLYPAAERGAKFTVFDVAHPDLIRSLENNGFTVQIATRPARGQVEVQPELIATNRVERLPRREMFVPTEQERMEISRLGIDQGGRGMLTYLQTHPYPFLNALGKDLSKFWDSAQRVDSAIQNIDGGRTIRRQGDRFMVEFTPGLLYADEGPQGFLVAHELVHGLTMAELDKPTNRAVYDKLDDLRIALIKKLPRDMQLSLSRADETDWYGRHARGETHEPLHEGATLSQEQVLYGLTNLHEFVSQGLSSSDMREFLLKQRTGTESWFSRFTNLIKTVLGVGDNISGTAFEEFLSQTDQLLDRGNYLANFRNFGDRYFQNMGMRDDFARQNTNRAVGLLMGMDESTTSENLLDGLRMGAGAARSAEWLEANRAVVRMFQRGEEERDSTVNVIGEHGYQASPIGLYDFAHDLLRGDAPKEAIDLLPSAASGLVFTNARDAKNILSVLDAAARDNNKGLVNLRDPEMVKGPVSEALKQVNAILRVEDAHDRAMRNIQGLYSMTPDGFLDSFIGDPLAAPTWALDKDRKELGWIWRTLAPVAQIVRRLPESAEAFSRGYQLSTNTRKMRDEALKPLGTDLTTLTMNKQTLKATTNTLENRKLTGVIDRWIELTQRDGEKKGKIQAIPSDDPRVQKLLSGLSLTERDQVDTLMQQRLMSTQHMQNQILEKGLQISSTRGGSLLQKMVGGKLSTNVSLAGDLLNAFTADRSDPTAARAADMKMTQVQNQLTPEAFYDLAKFTENAAAEWTKYKEWFQENPDWASAQRYGQFIAEFKRGGKTYVVGVENRKEAESLAKGAPITSFQKNRQDDPDKPPYLGPDAVGTINFLREKQQVQIDILRNRGVISDQEGVEMLKRYSPVEQLATEETYRRGALGLTPQPRRLTKLSEEHPWLQNHFSWVTKTANYWSRQLLREQTKADLLDPEIAQNKELSTLLRDHYDNMLKPDSAFGRFMQKAASTWFMGLNVATAMVNGTQPFLTHVAELTSMTGKPLNSYRRVLKALGEAVDGGLRRTWKTPDHEWLMEQAANDGIRDLSMHDEQAATQETLSTNFKRAMQRNKVQSTGQRLGTMAGTFSNVGLWMFRQVERLNNDAALLASFDYYRESEPNLSRDEAYAKAKDFNSAVNYGGGAAQRPIGLYKGVPRTLAMLSTAMQTYTLGSSFQLARYIRAGLFRPDGLTPHEVYSARKAAVQMLGTQFALAGVLGLPFVSSAIAALDKAFPDLEVNKHLREWMHQIAGEDGENGNVLSDIGMTGIPSMMGWDVQSRLSMGNTVPGVSEINGFQPELLLGAPANMVTNFVQGGQKLITGQPRAADAFVPPALKKIFQLFRNDFQTLDYKNRPIFKPTFGEVAGIALGFQPKRLSDFNAAARIAALSQDNANRHEGQFHQQQAEEVLSGNFGSVKQALLQRSREDKAYDPVAAVRSIAGAAEELAFPRDLRREGTARSSDARSKLLSAFNLPPSQPSETDRFQFRSQVGQRLGLFSQSSTGLRQAQLMDELRKQQPEATRSELRQQASRLSRGPSLQRTALLQE